MFKRNCVVKYVDSFRVEQAAKVEAESLFEAAVRGLHRLDSSFWAEDDVFDRMCVTVEVYEEPTTHRLMVQKLKQWIKSHGKHPREKRRRRNYGNSCLGTKDLIAWRRRAAIPFLVRLRLNKWEIIAMQGRDAVGPRLSSGLRMVRSLTIGVVALGLFSLLLFPSDHNPVRAATSGTETQHSDAESLIQIEKDLFKAQWTNDPEVVGLADKVLADDWVNLEPDRRGPGKPEMMELLHRLFQDKKTLPKPIPDKQQRDLQVFLFGNAAVATYFEEDTAKPDQHPLDVTDVFVKDDGTWRLRLTRGSLHFQQ